MMVRRVRFAFMRRGLPSAILVASVLGTGLVLSPIAARAVGVTPTLRLSPDHGQASASFTATYNLSPCQASPGTSIDFYWNEYPPNGGQRLGAATLDATCTARLTTSPPAGTSPGSDLVYGFWALPDGSPLAGTIAARAYTVDPPPAGATPTPSSPPGPSPTAGAPTPPGAPDDDSWLRGGLQSSSSSGASSNSSSSGFGPPPYINTPLGRVSLVALLLAAVALLLLLLILMVLAILLLILPRRRAAGQTVDRAA